MIEIFNGMPRPHAGVVWPAQWEFVRRNMASNIERYQSAYRSTSKTSRIRHVLIDLLINLGVSMRTEYSEYVYRAESRLGTLSQALRLCSEVSPGQSRPSSFYGPNVEEVILAVSEPFVVSDFINNWKNEVSVKPLTHPITSFVFPHPFEINHPDGGLSVIQVDIPKLALQYRLFVEEQSIREDQLDIVNFMGRYIWPNMMKDHMEQVWHNRLFAKQFNTGISERGITPAPFAVTILESSFVACAEQVFFSMQRVAKDTLYSAMDNIPSLSYSSTSSALALPDLVSTNNVLWLGYACRLKHINFLLSVADGRFSEPSRDTLNQMFRQLQYGQVQRYMGTQLSGKAFEFINSQLQLLMSKMTA
jgi:hypothetical protein